MLSAHSAIFRKAPLDEIVRLAVVEVVFHSEADFGNKVGKTPLHITKNAKVIE